MNRSVLFSIFLLTILVLSACQPSAPAAQPPDNASVADAFSPQSTFCEFQTEWTVEATTKDWIDVTSFWVAVDEATAQDNFKHLSVEIKLDSGPVAEAMKYPEGPETYSVTCPDAANSFSGSRMKWSLFLPPLSKGAHTIVWKYTIEADINDGFFDYPKGTEQVLTATLNVK